MEEHTIDLRSLFGGIPFLDNGFNASSFMSAIAVARRYKEEKTDLRPVALQNYITPGRAVKIYDRLLGRTPFPQANHLSKEDNDRINESISGILHFLPEWAPMFQIPFRFVRLKSDSVIGSSNASVPQTIFLGNTAWKSDAELREQVLHEIAHVWLYMIEELWPLHTSDQPGNFTLPSGTSGKTGTGVLNASFVSAILVIFYSSANGEWKERREYLARYSSRCLDLIKDYNGLTNTGREIYINLSLLLKKETHAAKA